MAQVTRGEGGLNTIIGSISADDSRDAYCIKVLDPESFQASIDPRSELDARLFLFDERGASISPVRGSSLGLSRAGEYVLMVAGVEPAAGSHAVALSGATFCQDALDAVLGNFADPERICRGDGSGAFPVCADVGSVLPSPGAVVAGFVDGDANLDVLFADDFGQVCLGDGFSTRIRIWTSSSPSTDSGASPRIASVSATATVPSPRARTSGRRGG